MKVGKISSYDLQKSFSGFFNQMQGTTGSGFFSYCPRIIHNQQQIVRCQLRDGSSNPSASIKYWNMDGTAAAQFTVGSGGLGYKQILDISWINDEEKYVYVTMDPDIISAPSSYSVFKCASDGLSPELIVYGFTPTEYASWTTSSYMGYVQVCASDTDIFVKVGPTVYKFPEGLAGDWASISSSVTSNNTCFHYGDGTGCDDLAFQPTVSGTVTPSGHLLYSWYDSAIDVLYFRNIDAETLQYVPDKWAMLNIADYNVVREPLFLNQLDRSSLHALRPTSYSGTVMASGRAYPTTVTYLHVFNVDESLAAFLNVNSSDVVMPAGVGATADIFAQVTNCWGTTLSGKLVQFWVSSGDGGVYPAWDYTDAEGNASTLFTSGANVGLSNVAVVVNEI
jgi:hypothetical protein